MKKNLPVHRSFCEVVLFFFFVFFVNTVSSAQQAGDIDSTFNTSDIGYGNGDGANSIITATVLQNDGKILVAGGGITSYNGKAVKHFFRIHANGIQDTSFNAGLGPNYDVRTIVFQPDGKILIGGTFTVYNGSVRNRIARINPDGSLDTSFNPGIGADSDINKIVLLNDGKILIGGWFTTFNGNSANYIARLNPDGTLDTSFSPPFGANSGIYSITPAGNNKILIGGWFTTFNGTTRNRIACIDTLGNIDNSFNPGTGANDDVNEIFVQDDGKYLAMGCFTNYNGFSITGIARINPDGGIDSTFNPGSGTGGCINAAVLQNDNRILIGGAFTIYDGKPTMTIVRINENGSLDTAFNAGSAEFDYTIGINSIAIQNDEKIIVSGGFSYFNGIQRNRITRLNADGSWDETFNPGTGANGKIFAASLQPDEKIIIGGGFTSCNGFPLGEVARLNPDGTIDTSFTTGKGAYGIGGGLLDPSVYVVGSQPDGKIIIGGGFIYYDGVSRNRIARLNSDGSLDSSFNVGNGLNGYVNALAIQQDNKIIIGGDFSNYNGISTGTMARINPDGTLDNSFTSGANGYVDVISLQPDGKIIIGGYFTSYSGNPINRIARINSNGTLDISFNPGSGSNNGVSACAIQPDGKIIIGGAFTTINGTARNRIARINNDGSLDTTFTPGLGAGSYVTSIALSSLGDGKIIIGGGFGSYNGITINRIARLNTNGTLDNTFNVGAGTGANSLITDVISQNDGKIIIAGDFTSYKGTGRNRISRIWSACSFSLTITKTDVSCFTAMDGIASAVVSGGVSPYLFNWSNSSITDSIFNLSGGNYSVTVTDSSNCFATATVIINEPSGLSTNDFISICAGDSVFLQGNFQKISGIYYDTLTAVNGCDSVIETMLTVNQAAAGNQQWAICNGDSAFVGGNYQTTAGIYFDTLLTIFGCDSIVITTLSVNSKPVLSITTIDVLCHNVCNGTINPNASGGTTPYQYLFSTGSDWWFPLCVGNYSFTVTDANGCMDIDSAVISQPDSISISSNTTSDHCGLGTGTATVITNGGTGSFTYLWNTGQSTQAVFGLFAGSYSVIATDENGCADTGFVSIEPDMELAPILILNDISCNGYCDGSAYFLVSGLIPPYWYVWSTGDSSQTETNLCVGTYNVTATDSLGCTVMSSAAIQEPAPIVIALSFTPDSGNSTGAASVITSGGISPYSYLWSTGDSISQITNLESQYYFITVTDANGCTAEDSVFIDFYTGEYSPISNLPSQISIYPNPNYGKFIVWIMNTDFITANYESIVYNLLGEVVHKSKVTNEKSEIDLKRIGSGVYYVQVVSDSVILTKKVLLE